MKKMLIIIISIVGIMIVVGIVLSVTPFGKSDKTASNKDIKIVAGPYSCNGKLLIVEQLWEPRGFDSPPHMKDLTVSYGENLAFTNVYWFRETIEKKQSEPFGFSKSGEFANGYEEYLATTQMGEDLSSWEELSSRGMKANFIDHTNKIILGSTQMATAKDLKEFVECFRQNKKDIYDKIVSEALKAKVTPVYFEKAYLLKI